MRTERAGEVSRRAAGNRRARCSGDQGAIIAEAALLTPFFITMLFGLLEFGGAFRDYLTLNNGVSAGARQASIAANGASADQSTLDAIKAATAAMPTAQIQKIIIYYAKSPTAQVPATCLSGPQSTVAVPRSNSTMCNVYTPAIYPTTSVTNWGACAQSTDPDHYYCPTSRVVSVNGPPDYVGIYIQIKHPWITGLFGQSLTMSKTTIARIEPQSLN